MITNELSEAAVEFNCILKYISPEITNKIPKKFLNFLNEIASKTYEFHYDETKKLNEQNLKNETRGLISLVYQDYICNENEKKEYMQKCYEYNKRKEEIAKIKYNPENLFKTKPLQNVYENELQETTSIVEYKPLNFIQKIINKIQKFLKIR